MASEARISLTGKKQGQFKGEPVTAENGQIQILSFTMGLKSPRDLATGQASGKRQFEPVTIVKEWGSASPQGLTSCSTNEVLSTVSIEFLKTNIKGEEFAYQTVTLTDATLFQVQRFTGNEEAAEISKDGLQLERWSFTFRKIEVDDKDGKTVFADDWTVGSI